MALAILVILNAHATPGGLVWAARLLFAQAAATTAVFALILVLEFPTAHNAQITGWALLAMNLATMVTKSRWTAAFASATTVTMGQIAL